MFVRALAVPLSMKGPFIMKQQQSFNYHISKNALGQRVTSGDFVKTSVNNSFSSGKTWNGKMQNFRVILAVLYVTILAIKTILIIPGLFLIC